MAETNEPTDEGRPETADTSAEDQAAETEASDLEDVELDDEEISERVRGGIQSISVPF